MIARKQFIQAEPTYKFFFKNPTSENLHEYKKSRAKQKSWRFVFVSKINPNMKPKILWQIIWKIPGKTVQNTIKQLSYNNTKITNKKDIADHLAETFSENSSSKSTAKHFKTLKRTKKRKSPWHCCWPWWNILSIQKQLD